MALPLAQLYNYDAKSVTAFINGVLATNFADGDHISIAMNEDQWKLKIGNTGEGTRSKTNNLSARFTFNLMQSSPMNEVLSGFMATDMQVPLGTVIPIAVRDNMGTSFFVSPTCWLVKWPEAKFAMEAQGKQWVYETNSLSMQFHGGNFAPLIV